ncbi:hypothetical protein [Streptomyces hoynatensis]|uniref:GerMN domain-containing protein n=1 Tax=Streptomyces hoynatensis TaxID=1141874 RepID=A0A3A9ZBL2_9ACTN|nr:hypothetical protein [Streptomyces hoynatensis]RKN45653.1 hypothetical protein D7294_04060 [Streptomyces hoynatensis]
MSGPRRPRRPGRTPGGPRPPAALGLLPAAALLAACGVPPSDVIQTGPPATGLPADTLLYFVSPYDDSLVATPRRTEGPADVSTALGLLLDGPDEEESDRLATRLSGLPGPPAVTTGLSGVVLTFSAGTGPLDETAQGQLVCTAAEAFRATGPTPRGRAAAAEALRAAGEPVPAPGPITVELRGDGWKAAREASFCPEP